MHRVGKASISYDNTYLISTSAVVGPRENEGPLHGFFDKAYDDLSCNEINWEKAEMRLQDDALRHAMDKAKLVTKDLDLVVSGDLNNQIVISSYLMREYDIPHIGIYGACSTCTLALIVGSMFIEGNVFKNVACLTSSHYATSERQFRYPTEYGGQKPSSMTSTVTGAGCGIITSNKTNIKIKRATIGKVYDAKMKDAQDLGTAMAPAAALVLKQHLDDFKLKPDYYDLIITGDLSKYGTIVFKELLKTDNVTLNNHLDCGNLIYDQEKQEVFAGGSGAGCCSVVTYGYLCKLLTTNKLKRILVIATGALMNPILTAQKESIPSIAHAIAMEKEEV